MTVKLNYQYRIYPYAQQVQNLNEWLRICRYLYNRWLGQCLEWWERNRCAVNACPLICHLPELADNPYFSDLKKQLPGLKKDLVNVQWSGELLDLSSVYSTVLQDVYTSRLKKAMDRFIQCDKNGKRSGESSAVGGERGAYGVVSLRRQPPNPEGFPAVGDWRAKAGARVIAVNPAHTSQLLAYRDEFVFTDCSIREYWDDVEKLWVDRDINAAINLKRVGLDVFPTINRAQREGNEIQNSYVPRVEVLSSLRGFQKPTLMLAHTV